MTRDLTANDEGKTVVMPTERASGPSWRYETVKGTSSRTTTRISPKSSGRCSTGTTPTIHTNCETTTLRRLLTTRCAFAANSGGPCERYGRESRIPVCGPQVGPLTVRAAKVCLRDGGYSEVHAGSPPDLSTDPPDVGTDRTDTGSGRRSFGSGRERWRVPGNDLTRSPANNGVS